MTCVLALATLTACSSGGGTLTGGEPVARGVAGGPGSAPPSTGTSSAPPSGTALTPEGYKSELSTRKQELTAAIGSMMGAKSVKTLDQRMERAEAALRGAADALALVSPPPEVKAQHDAYVGSLRAAAAQFGATLGKVGSRDVCTAGGVLTDLGAPLKQLDEAGAALQAAGDYPADVVTVKAAAKQSRRLKTGQFLKKESLTGRSSMQIHNGASRDAVVTLMRGDTKAFSVYVGKKKKYKVSGVRDGKYRIYFTHGVDWDGKSKAFTRDCSFERFQSSVRFKTTYTATQIRWNDWKITLHAITGGNAPTDEVDPESFPK
ncbi:hypothetical protein [Nonomuraea typhae]|uniref:hypothetical protein n=1 Tax=Nonomuraea typhae TaxID=2603600 RepID=UPI0012FAEDC1|nr:hypothetical protein [Nonomuraea typhae]